MGVQDRRRETDTERSLVGVFQRQDQLEREERNLGANGQRLRGREQRDKEMLSPPLTRTWRFVKGIGTAVAQVESWGGGPGGLRRVASNKWELHRR